MMILSTEAQNKKIIYLEIKVDLSEFENLDLTNWVVLVIENNIENPILKPFANLCIDKSVLNMHATGNACKEVDDLFDLLMVIRQEKKDKLPLWMVSEDDVLMTSWDYNFGDAFWFITTTASYEDKTIDSVLICNLTDEDYLIKIQKLLAAN